MTEESPDYTLALESAGPSARGGFEFRMRPGIDLAKHLTQSVRSVLDGHGAENYVEMRFDDGEGNEYIATFRRRGGKTPDELRRQAEAERNTAREVARGNKRHVAVLAEVIERVEKFADEMGNYCSPRGVAAQYADRLREVLHAPTSVEKAGRMPGLAGDRVEDGGVMGTLVRCTECGGDGLLHKPDQMPPPTGPQQSPEP